MTRFLASIRLLCFLGILLPNILLAEVNLIKNDTMVYKSKKEKKTMLLCGQRAASFYSWYINYLISNNAKPLQHLVINQYTTAHLRDMVLQNNTSYDHFMASDFVDAHCIITIMPLSYSPNRIRLKATVTGRKAYAFTIDMIVQKGNWCLDLIVADEDMEILNEDKE